MIGTDGENVWEIRDLMMMMMMINTLVINNIRDQYFISKTRGRSFHSMF